MLKATLRPLQLFDGHLRGLVASIPGLRDADSTAIHDARILTRRIRSLVPLIADDVEAAAPIALVVRDIGRTLGRVREADATLCVIGNLELRTAGAYGAFALIRQGVSAERDQARRRLVKQLDVADWDDVRQWLARGGAHNDARWFRGAGHHWHGRLFGRLQELAERAHERLVRASGVYLPNRLHRLRVAAKKLRYTLEVASAVTGAPVARRMVRDVRRVQNILGDIHDVQVLADRAEAADFDREGEAIERQRHAVAAGCRGECAVLHRTYLERRESLDAVCGALMRNARVVMPTPRIPLVAASFALAPAAAAVALARLRR
jgi:CHAD domain-containing protein